MDILAPKFYDFNFLIQRKLMKNPAASRRVSNSHITNTAAATLWQATGNSQVKRAYTGN